MSGRIEIRVLTAAEAETCIETLAEILSDCVQGGAGVGFMLPFSREDALAWWPGPIASARRGERVILGGFADGVLCGTVQLVTATPPNQPHRADIAKMLVGPAARGRGLGAALMLGAEAEARARGKTLLVLDTVTGSDAERLYQALGWQRTGVIPDFALSPHGNANSTTILWKKI